MSKPKVLRGTIPTNQKRPGDWFTYIKEFAPDWPTKPTDWEMARFIARYEENMMEF